MTQAEKRRQYLARAKQSAHAVASRTARQLERNREAERAANNAVYATNVSELSRAANVIGVIRNDRLVIPKGPIRKGMQVGMTQSAEYEGRGMTQAERDTNRAAFLQNTKPFSSTTKPLNAVHVAGHNGNRAHIDQRTTL